MEEALPKVAKAAEVVAAAQVLCPASAHCHCRTAVARLTCSMFLSRDMLGQQKTQKEEGWKMSYKTKQQTFTTNFLGG